MIEKVAGVLADMGHEVQGHVMDYDAEANWKTYTDMTCVETAAMFGFLETVVGRPVTVTYVHQG